MFNRKIFICLFVFLIGMMITARSFADSYIPKGSFVNGILAQTISSEFNNKQDAVKFLITQDFYSDNTIIIPKNSVFIGYVSDLKKAEQGRNGYFSVDFYGMLLPTGETIPMKGHLFSSSSSNILGGELTRRSGYKKTMHRSECFGRRGILQLNQYGPRILGSETKIKAGSEMVIMLDEDMYL